MGEHAPARETVNLVVELTVVERTGARPEPRIMLPVDCERGDVQEPRVERQ